MNLFNDYTYFVFVKFQGQDGELGLAAHTDEDDERYPDTDAQSDDFIPRSFYDNAQIWDSNFGDIVGDKHLSENDEDMAVKRAFENQFFGSRGKRMGFLSSLPSGYRGWYTSYQQRPRKRFHPNMFVSMRGKRLDDTNSRSLANYMDLLDGKEWFIHLFYFYYREISRNMIMQIILAFLSLMGWFRKPTKRLGKLIEHKRLAIHTCDHSFTNECHILYSYAKCQATIGNTHIGCLCWLLNTVDVFSSKVSVCCIVEQGCLILGQFKSIRITLIC